MYCRNKIQQIGYHSTGNVVPFQPKYRPSRIPIDMREIG